MKIHIQRIYYYPELIIPIGKDCSSAYILKSLGLRKYSLPYDWMRLKSYNALSTVASNIKENFKYYQSDLQKNEDGNVYSLHYPDALFTHFKYIYNDYTIKSAFQKKCELFMSLFDKHKINFLIVVSFYELESSTDIAQFRKSIIDFFHVIKTNDILHVILRYDNNEDEGRLESIVNILNSLKEEFNLEFVVWKRDITKYGDFGNRNDYKKIMKNLNINISERLPKINFY